MISEKNTEQAFDIWAKAVAKQTGLQLQEKIYQGIYYHPDFVRNAIYSGVFQEKPAVLKLYDDPRLSDEPLSLKAFHEHNQSNVLKAPVLYEYEVESRKRGWLIMEHLPEGGAFYGSPLSQEQMEEVADLYLEYRKNFPVRPTRDLVLAERLPAHEYHRQRIAQWFRLANDKEVERVASGEKPLLDAEMFIPLYLKALNRIDQEFQSRTMVWCHGHFKPHELYKVSDQKIYLTDFAHSKLYPEGYELAFIVWADRLMMTDWKQPYEDWKSGIDEWKLVFEKRSTDLHIERFDDLWRTSLIERALGTILADIVAAERSRDEQEGRLVLLTKLLRELLP